MDLIADYTQLGERESVKNCWKNISTLEYRKTKQNNWIMQSVFKSVIFMQLGFPPK